PAFPVADRARLQATDPEGLRRFDAKVAATNQAAHSTARVPMRLALNWNRDRFGSDPTTVVLETVPPPPPASWLLVTVDGTIPSRDGPEPAGSAQTSTNELEHALFVDRLRCTVECAPSFFNPVEFSTGIPVESFARALSVRDITDSRAEAVVSPKNPVKAAGE